MRCYSRSYPSPHKNSQTGHIPMTQSVTEVPTRYETKQVEIAVYLYNKRGAEGQTSHSENGINRTYESADVPESLMRGITPYVGVFGLANT